MADVRVTTNLPYLLLLPEEDYPTPGVGGSVRLQREVLLSSSGRPGELYTKASAVFTPPELPTEDEKKQHRVKEADRLLRRVNHLLRWYRAVSGQAQITELSRAQASPFSFTTEENGEGFAEPLEYEATRVPLPDSLVRLNETVREGLASEDEPPVSRLSLIDAEYAIGTGRFREAVLFCWSAIDSTFGRKYETLVDNALEGEWSEARKFLRGHADIPLRHRMSAVMHLVASRSLYREADLWEDLSTSYDHRNNIIHRGDSAIEADAILALDVARKVVAIMDSL